MKLLFKILIAQTDDTAGLLCSHTVDAHVITAYMYFSAVISTCHATKATTKRHTQQFTLSSL